MSKRHRHVPTFTGLVLASVLLRVFAGLSIIVGLVLTILILVQASDSRLSAGATLAATMPGVAILLWSVFIFAAGEALIALKVIAESTDETAYILRRKLMSKG